MRLHPLTRYALAQGPVLPADLRRRHVIFIILGTLFICATLSCVALQRCAQWKMREIRSVEC